MKKSDLMNLIKECLTEHWSEELGASPTSVVERNENLLPSKLEDICGNIISKANRLSDVANERREVQNKLQELYIELRGVDRDLQEYITTTLN